MKYILFAGGNDAGTEDIKTGFALKPGKRGGPVTCRTKTQSL